MIDEQGSSAVDVTAREVALPAGRREQIATLAAASPAVSVRALAARFGVSSDTVRRDLDQLAAEGRLVRTHGGAMGLATTQGTDGPNFLDTALTPAKSEVGALAARLVADGAVLMINAGATPVAAVRALRGRSDLTIVTNNLLIPPAIPPGSCRSMYVLGGEVRLEGQSTVGSVSRQLAGSGLDVRADLALISVGGVTVERGYSVADLPEATMMHEMLARAAKVAVLADASKFGRQLFANVAELGEADYFISDVEPPGELRAALLAQGVEIMTASSAR